MINERIVDSYIPMTETGFYILLSLLEPRHGYGIIQHVEELTNKRIHLGAGTIYGSLSKMEKDDIIRFVNEENKRKIYVITSFGKEILQAEIRRIEELYSNTRGVIDYE